MARPLRDTITIADADGDNRKQYQVLVDEYGRLQWFEEGASEDTLPPGEPVPHKWRFWGGGMGETVQMGRGGYYYSENAYHGDPFALKPRPQKQTVTLTDNTVPVERIFEAEDSGGNKYLYGLAATKSFKIKLSDQSLAETKTWTNVTLFDEGTYEGDGNATQAITGVGFEPCAVIVKNADGGDYGVIRIAGMAATYSKKFSISAYVTDCIRSFDADGFTVGDDDCVNTNGDTYYYQAWKAQVGAVNYGTYDGDGTDDREITGAGFRPAVVFLTGNTTEHPVYRASTFGVDESKQPSLSQVFQADMIQSFSGDGFQIGSHNAVNKATPITYHWLALRAIAGMLNVGTYVATGVDSKPITGIGFEPTYVIICTNQALYGVHRNATIPGDSTQWFRGASNSADYIESLDSDGFTIGTENNVNTDDETYHYMAVGAGGTATPGKPAEWLGKSRAALGSGMDVHTLTTVATPPTEDTWTREWGLWADHLCVCGNKLAKAYQNRKVALCSDDDISDLDNWGAIAGGGYDVGPPDCVITDLLDWGSELAVPATDGMYMFDGVALSRQQLPLLGGLRDDDNGKNSLGVASFIFYPSADGYFRWYYGSHKAVGPDSILGYVPAKETSNEPLNLKHYGSAFCGEHVYYAAYDGTNYLLLHGKLDENGELVTDCLLSTTNAIKLVYVDSDRRLWFGWGNDLAWIQLSQGGEADGGNFGEASLVTTIYLDQIILADDIDVRLRMVKVICRNSDAEYKWQVYASRDGGAFAQVGGDITADGVTELYWTASSNLTARRLRLKVVGTATGSFTPTTTPPEIIGIEFFGETMVDEASIVRAVVDLESGGRSAKTVKAELRARRNAGVVQVRDPIDGQPLDMIIYRCDLARVRQKGHEPATAGMMLYMRYGDTS